MLILSSLEEELGRWRKTALATLDNALHGVLVPQEHCRSISPPQTTRAEVKQKLHFPGLKDCPHRPTLDEFPNEIVEAM
jgi:hypothetical protein